MLFAVLGYMGVVAFWKAFRMGSVAPLLSQWTFLVGIPVGVLFVWADVVIEAYLQPGSQASRMLKGVLRSRENVLSRANKAITLVRSLASHGTHLCSQNVLFAGLWVVMALFGLTSTSSSFGKGVVLGIGLQLVVRLVQSMRVGGHEPLTVNNEPLRWFFWPIRANLSIRQRRFIAEGFLALFLFLTLLA